MFEEVSRAFWAFWDNQEPERAEAAPIPQDAAFGFAVTNVSQEHNTLYLSFFFRAGHRYCCESIGCMCCRLFVTRDWEGLRRWLRTVGVDFRPPTKVVARVEIERGALFAIEPAEPGKGYREERRSRWDVYVLDEAKQGEPASCVDSSE